VSAVGHALAKGFFASLCKALTNRVTFVSRDAARCQAFDYIEAFYNRVRRHSTIDYHSPDAIELIICVSSCVTESLSIKPGQFQRDYRTRRTTPWKRSLTTDS